MGFFTRLGNSRLGNFLFGNEIIETQNDRINTMSAEEKAEWLFEHDRITAEKGRLSKEELLQWLKSEVKE